jgi:hypothetical protein
MQLKRVVSVAIALLLVPMAGWSGVKVDWDHAADFSTYKTYTWGEGTPAKNPLMAQRITDGIDQQLATKGLKKVEPGGNPDLVVAYHAAVGHETELNTMGTGGWGWHWGGGTQTTTVNKIPVGQLTVNIGDAKTKKLLWMGNASDTLSDNPEKNTKKIEKALNSMFKKFPPPEKKK